jgi:hypothetical protein
LVVVYTLALLLALVVRTEVAAVEHRLLVPAPFVDAELLVAVS